MARKPYSRYSNYWYGVVYKMIQIYPFLEDEETPQIELIRAAVDKSIEETKKLPDGDLRMQAVKMLYFDKTHTIEGVAMQLFVSGRTVKRWGQDFVKLVGRNSGYM